MSSWWSLIRDGETDVDFEQQDKKLDILRQLRRDDLVEAYRSVSWALISPQKIELQTIASKKASRFVIVAYGQQYMRQKYLSGDQNQVEGNG